MPHKTHSKYSNEHLYSNKISTDLLINQTKRNVVFSFVQNVLHGKKKKNNTQHMNSPQKRKKHRKGKKTRNEMTNGSNKQQLLGAT
uniref:Ovule protein n=1 Tax=Ascaris lumbricoides TaxID=6252 RepID=A0A9J2PYC0_ASCLU